MPEISRFFGMTNRNFHAIYAGQEAQVGIDPVMVIMGRLPGRAASMVLEWAALHQGELVQNWRRLRNGQQVVGVEPLE